MVGEQGEVLAKGRRRKAKRKHVLILARCRGSSSLTDRVSITDLTIEGCCISYPGSALAVGQEVTIRPEKMNSISGTVRWVSAEGAGIEFERPLYQPVAEHLQREFAGFGVLNLPEKAVPVRSRLRPV